MTELTDVLPITTAFDPAFIIFRKTFDECIEELEINAGDYEYRMKKQKNLNKKNMQFLLLELWDYMKDKIITCDFDKNNDYPKYKGRIYKSGYIFKINDRFQNTLDYELRNKNRYNIPAKNCWFKKNYYYFTNDEVGENIIYHPHSYDIKTWCDDDNKYKYEKVIVKPEDMIKVRCLYKTMNYQLTRTYQYNATNIKYYDATTGKTTNKGLKAIHFYTYENNEKKDVEKADRGGWVFGGLKVEDMKDFVKKNGFNFEKGKKYTYGDYANWVLKTLN